MKKRLQAAAAWEAMELPQNQRYYDRLHDKIMAKIEEAEMEAPPIKFVDKVFEKSNYYLRLQWRDWLKTQDS